MKNMRGTPQRPDPNRPGMDIPVRLNFDEPADGIPIPMELPRKGAQVRRMQITEELLAKYGDSEDCIGCRN